jgi:hypothetical protein
MMTLINKKILLLKEVRKKTECGDHHCSYFCVLFKLKSRSVIVPIAMRELSVIFFFIAEMEVLLRITFRIATMLSVFFHRHCVHRHDRVFICFWSLYSMLGNAVLISTITTAGM